MDDLISRHQAINEANAWLLECLGVQKQDRSCGLIRRLEDLPSAQPDLNEWCHDCKEYDKNAHCCHRQNKVIRQTVDELKDAQPEYKPVTAEDFAKTMSENTIYGFMAWYGEAFTLIKEMGFEICKKTM